MLFHSFLARFLLQFNWVSLFIFANLWLYIIWTQHQNTDKWTVQEFQYASSGSVYSRPSELLSSTCSYYVAVNNHNNKMSTKRKYTLVSFSNRRTGRMFPIVEYTRALQQKSWITVSWTRIHRFMLHHIRATLEPIHTTPLFRL